MQGEWRGDHNGSQCYVWRVIGKRNGSQFCVSGINQRLWIIGFLRGTLYSRAGEGDFQCCTSNLPHTPISLVPARLSLVSSLSSVWTTASTTLAYSNSTSLISNLRSIDRTHLFSVTFIGRWQVQGCQCLQLCDGQSQLLVTSFKHGYMRLQLFMCNKIHDIVGTRLDWPVSFPVKFAPHLFNNRILLVNRDITL